MPGEAREPFDPGSATVSGGLIPPRRQTERVGITGDRPTHDGRSGRSQPGTTIASSIAALPRRTVDDAVVGIPSTWMTSFDTDGQAEKIGHAHPEQ